MGEQPETPGGDLPELPERPAVSRASGTYIDQIIARAQAEGHFDNLPGQGKPQQLDDDSLVPEDSRAAYRLLKANDFAPPWIEVRKEITQERARLEAWLQDANRRWPHMSPALRSRTHADYHRKLNDLHRTILDHNLSLPPSVPHLENIRLSDELDRLGHGS
jgi:hypothetical protein